MLIEKVWAGNHDVKTNVLNAQIYYIRKKIRESGLFNAEETVRGMGYLWI